MLANALRKSSWMGLLVAGAFVLIAYIAYTSWATLSDMMRSAHLGWIIAGIFVLSGANVTMANVFAELVRRTGRVRSTDKAVVGSYLVSQAGKYIPGRVWSVAMQSLLLGKPQASGYMFVVNMELAVVNLLLVVGAGSAFLAYDRLGMLSALGILIAAYAVAVWAIKVNGFSKSFGLLERVLPKLSARFTNQAALHGQVDCKPFGYLFAWLAGFLVLYCIGWFLLAYALVSLDVDRAVKVVSMLSLSYVVGVASMLPAGIGAREGVLIALAPLAGVAQIDMAAIAVLTRAAMLVMDGITAVIGTLMLRNPWSQRPDDV